MGVIAATALWAAVDVRSLVRTCRNRKSNRKRRRKLQNKARKKTVKKPSAKTVKQKVWSTPKWFVVEEENCTCFIDRRLFNLQASHISSTAEKDGR